MASFQATIGARINEFMAKMRAVQSTIKSVANDVRIDIGADVSKFNRQAAEIKAKALALARDKIVIKVEARIEEFQSKINRIATNIRAFGELAQHTFTGLKTSLLPAIVPLISNVGVAIANLGPMLGTVAGSTFALVGAFGAAGAAAAAFAAVAIPTIKDLFNETGPPFTKLQLEAHNAKEAVVKTYKDLVKQTETPVLIAFREAMVATDSLLTKLQPLFLSSANAVAGLMEQLNKSIGTPPVQEFLQYLNDSGASMLTTFGQAFGNVFSGILSMLTAFKPLSEATAQGFLEMTQRFAEWAEGLKTSDKFQAFMDYVATNMPKIRAIFRDATAGVMYFFSAFGDSSAGMMDGLVNMMARFKEWSKSLSENNGFQQFMSYVQQTTPSVLSLIGNLTQFIINLGIGMAPLGAAILNLVNKFLEFANSMMENNRIIGILIAGFISFGGLALAIVPNVIALATLFKGFGATIMGLVSRFASFLPKLSTLGATFTNLATRAVPILGTALGMITSPVGLVITAITALTAIFVGLYKTNEEFRAQVQTIWSAIQTAISTAVNAVASLITFVWTQITSFWNSNQESIKATASTVWNIIGTVITTVLNAVMAVFQFVWPVVKALVVSTWDAITNVIQGATTIILGIIQTFSALFSGDWSGVWEGIKSILNGALQAVWGVINLYFLSKILGPIKSFGTGAKSLLESAWTAIKGIFTNTLNTIKTFVSTIWTSIKTNTSTVWEGIKSSISTILNAIKSTVTTIWNAIKTAIANVLSGISSVVSTVWNTIKSIITTALNGIKSVASSIWNGIKTTISSILEAIKIVISTAWNAIKTVVSTTMEAVKTTIINGWNAAKSFLENINLASIGKNIINGLIAGITSKFEEVKSTITGLANNITSWFKNTLGIHSPSRVMAELSKWLPYGVALGIGKNVGPVKAAMSDMAKVLISELEAANAEIQELAEEEAEKLAKIETDKAYQINQIHLKAKQAKRELTESENARIAKLEADAALKVIQTQETYADKVTKIQEKMDDERLKSIQTFISQKRELEQLNMVDEAEMWKASLALFEDGTDAKIKAQIKYKEALKTVNDELVSINETYADKIAQVNENLQKQEEELTKKYTEALAERERSLYNFANLFDAFEVKIDTSGKALVANLESQVAGFKQWQAEIETLSSKAIDEGLLAELRAMGPSALGELKALNSLSESELTKYSELYQEKMQLAREQAETELVGMREDTDKQIETLREESAKQLERYEKEWISAIESLTGGTKDEMNDLVADMPGVGANVIKGMMRGLSDMTPALMAQTNAIAESIKSTIESALDMHSPSRWGENFVGHNLVQGIINGIANMRSDAIQAAKDLAEWIKPSVEVSDIINDISGAIDAIQTEIEHKVKVNVEIDGESGSGNVGGGVHQEVHLHSPKHLSPSENARQLKRVAQQLAY